MSYKKGDYERYYEKIRKCLDANMGITEITSITKLSEDEVIDFTNKIQRKRE